MSQSSFWGVSNQLAATLKGELFTQSWGLCHTLELIPYPALVVWPLAKGKKWMFKKKKKKKRTNKQPIRKPQRNGAPRCFFKPQWVKSVFVPFHPAWKRKYRRKAKTLLRNTTLELFTTLQLAKQISCWFVCSSQNQTHLAAESHPKVVGWTENSKVNRAQEQNIRRKSSGLRHTFQAVLFYAIHTPFPIYVKQFLFSFPERMLPIARSRHVYQAVHLEVWHKIWPLVQLRNTLSTPWREQAHGPGLDPRSAGETDKILTRSQQLQDEGKANLRRTNLFHWVCLISRVSIQTTNRSMLRWKDKFFSPLESYFA